jgi:hypothetical protein
MWTALRGAGVPIIADWLDSPVNRDGEEPSASSGRLKKDGPQQWIVDHCI